MKKSLTLAVLGLFASAAATAQSAQYITASGNMYLPIGESDRGTYPILWYDKETEPNILVGGFGIGYAQTRQLSQSLMLKGQAAITKQTFWDEAIAFKDDRAVTITHYASGGTNYSAGLAATAHYPITDQVFIGAGLGTQILLVSLSRMPPISASANQVEKEIVVNKFYKRVLPTLPVELNLKTNKKLYTIRYEVGLLSPYRADLGRLKKDPYGLLCFEIGFKLGAKTQSEPESGQP